MKTFISIFLLLILLFGCTSEKQQPIGEMVFNVDSSRISDLQVVDKYGITFHPPKNWNIIDSELSEKLLKSTEVPGNKNLRYIYKPHRIYLNNSNSCLLSVGIVVPSSENKTTSGHFTAYNSITKENFGDSVLKEGSTQKNGLNFYHYLIRKADLISLKLIFETGGYIHQFDYTCPKQYYEQQLQSIESSIGTIHVIGEKSQ